jgi:hypothetical protein
MRLGMKKMLSLNDRKTLSRVSALAQGALYSQFLQPQYLFLLDLLSKRIEQGHSDSSQESIKALLESFASLFQEA